MLLACRRVAHLLTDYQEHALARPVASSVSRHLANCDACATYLAQIDATVAALTCLPPEPAPAALHRELALTLASEFR
jgi:anti-sigma factor RsiW